MDLLVAVIQRAAVVDVGWLAADVRVRQRPRLHAGASTGADRLDEGAVIRRNASPEVGRYRAGIRVLLDRDARIPSLEAIHISRLFGAARVQTTWLAPVFDIDAEDNPFRTLAASTAVGPLRHPANTGEDNSIGWRWSRFRAASAVVWIADDVLLTRRGECAMCADFRSAATEASAEERVIVALRRLRVEVNVDLVNRIALTVVMTMVRPLTADARIAQRVGVAIPVAEWSARLTTMSDLLDRNRAAIR